jgi:SulP family sulfate permease
VTGGFARSVVNFDAGAETPAAGAYTAVGLASPRCADAADLLSAQGDAGGHHHRRGAVLVDLSILKKTWTYSQGRFRRRRATILLTLGLGVEIGVSAGVILSIPPPLQDLAPARGRGRPGARHRAFPQHLRHKVETDPRC